MHIQPIVRPLQEFGPCLKQVLQRRKISASELARIMAYKSRNSIFRILDGSGGHGSRQAFYERLIGEDPLKLDDQERAQLTQALEISRVGIKMFLGNRAMNEMLMDASMEGTGETLIIAAPGDELMTFDGYAERISNLDELNLMITGCCDRQVFNTLAKYLLAPGMQCKVRITHFVYTGEEEIVRNISAIQPMLYSSCYTAYALEPGMFSREKQRAYRNNCVFLHARDKQGSWINRSFILVDKGRFLMMRTQDHDGFGLLEALIERDIQRMHPLKMLDAAGDVDYIAYTEACRRLEQNRSVYMIKQDVPISYVQTDILASCVLDGFTRAGIVQQEELEGMLEQLKHVHNQRLNNFFAKRKATHTIFSEEAMERFARTGRQSDHFFAFRAYTPQERVCVLTHLREQAEKNPNFHVYFFKPEYEAPPMEIALYEGAGTLLAKPNTHYNLAGDHAEVLISQDEFCACYKAYFTEDLLERHVLDERASLKVLDGLIEIAKNA